MNDTIEEIRVSMAEAAERSGLKRSEIYKRVKDGSLAGQKVDGLLTFSTSDVEKLVGTLGESRSSFAEEARRLRGFLAERLDPGFEAEEPEDASNSDAWAVLLTRMLLSYAVSASVTHIHIDPVDDGDRILVRRSGFLQILTPLKRPVADQIRAKLKGDAKAAADASGTIRGKLKLPVTDETTPPSTGFLTILSSALGEHLHLAVRADAVDRSPEDLGYSAAQAAALDRMLDGRPGLFIATGPGDPGDETHRIGTGVRLANQGRLVVSLERQDGLRDDSLVQLKYGVNAEGVSNFSSVFESALSARPDVVLFDRIDDNAQAAAVLRCAQSGCLAIAHVVAADFVWAIRRLGELGASHTQLAGFLIGASERRSLRRLCPECSIPADADDLAGFNSLSDLSGIRKPVGCDACLDGFAGKVNVFGLVESNASVRDALHVAEAGLPGFTIPVDETIGHRSALRDALAQGSIVPGDVSTLL